jgi:WD40 repeat protein
VTATSLAALAQEDIDSLDCAGLGVTPPRPERLRFISHASEVTSATFSPDSARIVTASSNHTGRIWDATTRVEITRIFLDAAVTALDAQDGIIALGDALGRVRVLGAQEDLSGKGSAR